jgi:hypothetical protein
LDSSSTHENHEAWLVDLGALFHMTPHGEWFYEYERYDGGNVFLGDELTTIIIGRGKFKFTIIYGRIRKLPSFLHIPRLGRNLIYVTKMDDAGVKKTFERETYRMVRGAMVLLKGVRFGTIYNMQGNTISDGCNSSIVPDIGVEEERTPTVTGEQVMSMESKAGKYRREGSSTSTW